MQIRERIDTIILADINNLSYSNSLKEEEQQKLTTFEEADPKEHLTLG